MNAADASQPVPTVTLRGGIEIPQIGLGVFQVLPQDTTAIVSQALQAGYRSIDTAAAYHNEAGVGQAIIDSGLKRSELFLTTKRWNAAQTYDETVQAFEDSLGRLKLDYVDLYLMHWPVPSRDLYVDGWRALIDIAASGRSRAIGVSNFNADHIERIVAETAVAPAINQVELHPGFAQAELREVHARHGIVTESWSPLAQAKPELLGDPGLVEIAKRHHKTAAQVVLRWHLQLGCVVIPKASSPARLTENISVFDFDLSVEEMARIEQIDVGGRIGPDPATFSFSQVAPGDGFDD
jgi:2,5-diketo-D-gluconate reductase A